MKEDSLFSPATFKRMVAAALLEFGPIFVFIASFRHFHIYQATLILMVATIISTVLTYSIQKRLPYVALYVALLTTIFGYLTIMHHQPRFIQMRDTLYDITCALTLLVGLMINVQFLKIAFNDALPMTNRAWMKLTYAWTAFFIFSAIANEYVRRTMPLLAWFHYKGFIIGLTLIFGIISLAFFYEKERKGEK